MAVGIAVAEAECARGITLHSTLVRLDGDYGAPLRERSAEEIADERRMKLAALRRRDRLDCREQIGAAQSNDDNWNDTAWPFRRAFDCWSQTQ
ncbi:hypothetical protein ACFU96_34645 [Streptomyces sp. NPDC057620]|uniref:hypothetical protein n=1 Tax=Streptomyces sp. NPDC057620 TaxID=3346185 RepID=UPI0036CDCA86